ncbi:MAG: hypothetical protein GAK31_02151 [Stenotrophomonas maltophilia]|uniref:TonB C-terminal domain-containing protein n=1 Tax=Stenotrophomonas maltophilia TaxID=40324 RepID=A0A7V8FFH0_STEMA|nr:MAG: hypothetical protein GAK31_02151 [Stenotrophomonas maltophilia]
MRPGVPARLRWSGSFAVAVLLHALVIGAAVWWSLREPAPVADVLPPEAVMVDLAEVPEAPPAPPTEIPPGPPQQQQQRSEQPPTPKPREPLPPPDVVPDVAEPYTPPTAQAPEKAADRANVDQTLAPPQVSARASERYAAQVTTAGQQSQAKVTWQGLLLGHLEKYRRYPRIAERRRDEGVVYVRFSVDRKGNTSNVRIGRSSGRDALDQATLETVARASPVPAPPDDVPGEQVEVMVPVAFFLRGR